MPPNKFFLAVIENIDSATNAVRPSFAALLATVSTVGNVAVWQDVVRGWSSLIVVVLGVPTALAMLIYWLFKVRKEWLDRHK